ncbi:StbB family protein [Burkholderia ubonensis]|uniref:StbB family protein n=1 Tax=Burkholderia ubonensis TaxID=101571 RepID=UPI00075617B4|nr:StbB family protein [Burkholderia ubonensis]KVW77401.1 StbB [Burkholderia ubonensis]
MSQKKVVVINFSGNVGKSTIANHLLAPRLDNAPIISVESINAGGAGTATVRGEQFGEIQENMMMLDSAVVDIGASNVEDFVELMKSYVGSHEEFDYFIVPTVPDQKQGDDTISTIAALSEDIGIEKERIRVVFNRVDPRYSVEDQFKSLFAYYNDRRTFTLRREAVMHINEIYSMAADARQSIDEILSDPTDYRALIREAQTPEDKSRLARMVSIKRLAVGVKAELDSVFKALTK